jgi:branched-chain amino acid transport system ATP-binding protein
VRGASIRGCRGEIVVILGPNGAGKSSLIKAIAGLVPISGGSVTLEGQDITAVPAHRKIRQGLAFVPQTENVFPLMSVEENLRLAVGVFPDRDVPNRRDVRPVPRPGPPARLMAGQPVGRAAADAGRARALIVKPRVLMLDEPSAGLSPKFVEQVFARLQEIRDLA